MNSLASVSLRFSELAEYLEKAHNTDLVDFGADRSIVVSTRIIPFSLCGLCHCLRTVIDAYLPWLLPSRSKETMPPPSLNPSIDYLAKVFGQTRMQRICQRTGLDFRAHGSSPLTCRELEWIIAQAAEVYEEDLTEFLQEIHSGCTKIRFLTQEETAKLRADFAAITTLADRSNEQLNRLFELLIPFKSIAHLFFNNIPTITTHAFDSGKLLEGMKERVYLYESLRREPHTEAQWIMKVIKRLVEREMPKGVVFRNAFGGYCKVHEVVFGKGAYKCFLKHIGKEAKEKENIVLYRGTRLPATATDNVSTIFEDFRSELGSQGPQATFEKTKALLFDPSQGFVSRSDECVTGIGMSLGSTQVKRDAVLFKNKFKHIYAVSGPAPDRASMKLYADYINSKAVGPKPLICYFWEADDVTQQLGDADLGVDCDPSKIDIEINILEPATEAPELPLNEKIAQLTMKGSFPKGIIPAHEQALGALALQASLMGPHLRNTLDMPHRIFRLSNQEHPELVNKILAHSELCDPKWEKMRQLVAFDKLPLQRPVPFAKVIEQAHK
jgi:hypothetical protein